MNKLGRVASRTETTLGEVHKLDYRYDVRGRLIEVLRDGASTAYSYDKNGNRTGAGGIAASYDAQDRLLTSGALSYAYTPSGHLAKKTEGAAITAYSYDALGNLLSVTLPDGTAIAYVIDAQGRRIGKKVNGALVKRWLYRNGLQPVVEVDATGTVLARYVYGSRPNVPDQIIQGGATYQIISDELGSPRLVVNAADDTVAQRIDYDAWGNVLSDSAPGFQPFGFAGGLYDPDTKLVRSGARDYDAHVGRWVSKDPILFGGRQENLYVYAANDPINFADPDGLLGVAVDAGGSFGSSWLAGALVAFGAPPVGGGGAATGFFVDFSWDGASVGVFSTVSGNTGVGSFGGLGISGSIFTDKSKFAGVSTGATIQGGALGKFSATIFPGVINVGWAAGLGVFFGAVRSETFGWEVNLNRQGCSTKGF